MQTDRPIAIRGILSPLTVRCFLDQDLIRA